MWTYTVLMLTGCLHGAWAGLPVGAPKVVVEANLESYCPCAPQWEADFQQFVMPVLGDVVELRRYWDGTAKADGSVSCFHGSTECKVNTFEECARVQASSWQQSLAYANCWNNCTKVGFPKHTCAGQYSFPKDTSLAEACAQKHGLNWTSITACVSDPATGGKMLWNSSKFADSHGLTPYGIKGLPVVFVDGKQESKFWDCNSHGSGHAGLIKAICNAYNGTKPAACAQSVIAPAPSAGSTGSCKNYGCDPSYWDPSRPCQCNSGCSQYGNCCSDYQQTCGGSGGSCKKYGCDPSYWDPSRQCQCNEQCQQYDNCCGDYQKTCGGSWGSCAKYGCDPSYWDPSRQCQCNEQCQQYDNCCSDYWQTCNRVQGKSTPSLVV